MTKTITNQQAQPSTRLLSRRTFLLGLGGVGVIGSGLGGFELWKYHHEHTAIYTYNGYRGEIQAVAWSPDGKRIACGGRPDDMGLLDAHGVVHIWDAFTGAHLFTHKDVSRTGEVTALAWSVDGTRMADAGSDQVYIWRPDNGQALVTGPKIASYSLSIETLAWSPDGTRIVSGGESNVDDPVARSWDTTSGKVIIDYHDPTPDIVTGTLYGVAWSPDGKWIATVGFSIPARSDVIGGYPIAQVWEAATGELIFSHRDPSGPGAITSVTWSPTSKQIAAGDTSNRVRIWDIPSQRLVLTYTGHSYDVWTVAWSPNGKWIASGSGDETAQIWDSTSGRTAFTYRGHTNAITSLAWSPDSAFIASGGNDKTVQVWQANV